MLLVALAALLAAYDDRAVFDWKGVTLNAVVSVLSTASRASLLYAISELISQWKWIVFTSTRRPLIDFERIDAASRGPLGSLGLMWKCKAVGYLRLGALVLLLSIAADPLTQQLIQYKQRVVYMQDANTTVNRAARFSRGNEIFMPPTKLLSEYLDQTYVLADADFSMQSAILYGLNQSMQNVIQQGNANCPTGNCTLDRIASRGTQYSYVMKVKGMILSSNGTAFRLPNGLYVDNYNGRKSEISPADRTSPVFMMASLGTANASETISTQDLDTLVWSMSMIRVDPASPNAFAVWPDLPPLAMECALFYCVNSYAITVTNGTLQATGTQVPGVIRVKDSWKPEGTHADAIAGSQNEVDSIAFNKSFSIIIRTDLVLSSPATGNLFNISQAAVDSISSYFQSTFASTLQKLPRAHDESPAGSFSGYYINSSQVQYEPGIMQALYSSNDLNATFAALAASMSNAIRTGADGALDGASTSVIGMKGEITTFYEIVWPWISLHCILIVGGLVFLGVTIWENQKQSEVVPLWRSSSLATMSRGQAVTDVLFGMQTAEQMCKKAKASRVSLFDKNDVASTSLETLDFDPLEVEQ
ncbi:hypothetical protein Daus18300_012787 [Diaporthe australafricana]|uniref:Uncharacterized protein n=1 Tax=Diaporthe australafricana TaxID=127596 RepID=A0ABR3W1H9_9PEZI